MHGITEVLSLTNGGEFPEGITFSFIQLFFAFSRFCHGVLTMGVLVFVNPSD